jgi:hypothetical protein
MGTSYYDESYGFASPPVLIPGGTTNAWISMNIAGWSQSSDTCYWAFVNIVGAASSAVTYAPFPALVPLGWSPAPAGVTLLTPNSPNAYSATCTPGSYGWDDGGMWAGQLAFPASIAAQTITVPIPASFWGGNFRFAVECVQDWSGYQVTTGIAIDDVQIVTQP